MTALSSNQQCYARGSYGSRTTSWYLSSSSHCPSLLADWNGCLEVAHIFSVLFFTGWGYLFLDSAVRGSQTTASFV
jgi:hypothetical protein